MKVFVLDEQGVVREPLLSKRVPLEEVKQEFFDICRRHAMDLA